METKYTIQDREAGNKIESFNCLDDAEKALIDYEKKDKEDGIFSENFYEIVES